MRQIKFRGKRLDNGEWVEGDLIQGQGTKAGRMYILPHAAVYPPGCHKIYGWNIDPATVTLVGLPTKQDIQRVILETATRTLTDEGVKMERIFEKEADAIINLFRLHNQNS